MECVDITASRILDEILNILTSNRLVDINETKFYIQVSIIPIGSKPTRLECN